MQRRRGRGGGFFSFFFSLRSLRLCIYSRADKKTHSPTLEYPLPPRKNPLRPHSNKKGLANARPLVNLNEQLELLHVELQSERKAIQREVATAHYIVCVTERT